MTGSSSMPRGRGSNNNPANRFEHLSLERDADWDPAQDPAPKTRFYRDLSQSIIYCYQPIERRLQLTRACPAVLAEFRNPVVIITKNHLVTRDIDLLRELAAFQAIQVNLSINSLNPDLAARLELRASLPKLRLAAVAALAKAGIPVGVLVAPIIPALNEPEIFAVLREAKNAGAHWAGLEILRLPLAVAPVFEQWLEQQFPQKKETVLNRLRAIRGGRLNDPRFGSRMRGEGIFAEQISRMFQVALRRDGLPESGPELSIASFRRPGGNQLELEISPPKGQI